MKDKGQLAETTTASACTVLCVVGIGALLLAFAVLTWEVFNRSVTVWPFIG